ncbi:MAG TPA: outer membrane protein assembly factor BamD [Thiolinea sp.]|nr:outer membrane protein assembly factor BamD [Thiolinea sp.]
MSTTTTRNHLPRAFAILLLSAGLAACSSLSSRDKEELPDNTPAETIYRDAQKALRDGQFSQAIKLYETLEARYPLGDYAQRAQLESAYAHYKYDEADTALDTIDRFARMNPGSSELAYAYYLRGLVNFNRGSGIVDKVFPRSISDLDTVRQKEAFQDFSRVVTRYPDSKYAQDAQQRLQFLRNTLADSEISVARYYMERGAWLAAFNRAEYAIKHYQGSPAVMDALEIKVTAARNLGRTELAADNLRVLEANFPDRAARFRQ